MAPRPRFKNLDPEKRKRILDAARTEFAENGFRDASYNKIIERAGISKGAMYYYFDDKADLYATVIHDLLEAHFEAFGGFEVDPSLEDPFWDSLAILFERIIRFMLGNPEAASLVKSFIDLKPGELGHALAHIEEAGLEMTAAVVAQGMALGAVRGDLDPDLVTRLVYSLGETLDLWWFGRFDLGAVDDATITSVVDLYIDLYKRMLLPAKPRG